MNFGWQCKINNRPFVTGEAKLEEWRRWLRVYIRGVGLIEDLDACLKFRPHTRNTLNRAWLESRRWSCSPRATLEGLSLSRLICCRYFFCLLRFLLLCVVLLTQVIRDLFRGVGVVVVGGWSFIHNFSASTTAPISWGPGWENRFSGWAELIWEEVWPPSVWVEEGVRSPDSSGSLDGRFPLTRIWSVNERFELKIFGGVWCWNYTDHGSRKIFLAIFKSWKSPSLKVVVLISSCVR